jgi:hypothetical protein
VRFSQSKIPKSATVLANGQILAHATKPIDIINPQPQKGTIAYCTSSKYITEIKARKR